MENRTKQSTHTYTYTRHAQTLNSAAGDTCPLYKYLRCLHRIWTKSLKVIKTY